MVAGDDYKEVEKMLVNIRGIGYGQQTMLWCAV